MASFQTIEKELQSNPELRLEDIKSLREWVNSQPHLPNIDDIPDVYLSFFLRRRYYNLERAKETIDNFLTFRTNVPQMSTNRRVSSKKAQNFFDTHYCIPLDQRDSNGNMVFLVWLHNPDLDKYDIDAAYNTGVALFDSWHLENGSAAGKTFVYDQRNLSISHIMRISFSTMKNLAYYNKDCDISSMKNMYVINTNAFTQSIYNLISPLIRRAAFQRIKLFPASKMDDFYKLVPKDCLPNEYGGKAGTLDELQRKSQEQMKRHEKFFETLDRLKVEESKRPPKKSFSYFFW